MNSKETNDQTMPVPDFQTVMLPTLEALADQKPHTSREVADSVATRLNVSEAEREELLPSGVQPKFSNRVAWVKTHLKRVDSDYFEED